MADKASHQGVTAPGYTAAEQNIDNTTEDVSNKAQGHKANLSNPSTIPRSDKAFTGNITNNLQTQARLAKRSPGKR
jgi:hypothetical protein